MAKVTEKFISRLLLNDIEPQLDLCKLGCLGGSNTSVYLIRLYEDVLSWLEMGKSFVDLYLTNYRNAFDLIRHLVAHENLSEMCTKTYCF